MYRKWVISAEQLLEIFESYFSQLYTFEKPPQTRMETFFPDLILPSISPEKAKILMLQ